MKRRASLLVVVALLLSACSRSASTDDKPAAAIGEPVPGDWAIVRFEAEPDTLNPLTSVTAVAHYALWGALNSQVYELLMGYSTNNWDVTEPLLAESAPTVSDDHLTYTVTIREGVTWHDGAPFTAEDVLFTYKAIACPSTDAAALRSQLADLLDIQVNGRSISFVMATPNVYNLRKVVANLAPIIPKHVFDPEGLLDGFTYRDIAGSKGKADPKIVRFGEQLNSSPANRAPVGTGPYKFEKWESGREIVLTRNENYWGRKPYLDRIVYRIISDPTSAFAALKSGEIDIQPRLLPIQYKEQTSGPGFDEQFTKVEYAIPASFQIFWNNDRPFFNDKRVRQAMTMLIDRQKIVDAIRGGLGQVAASPFAPQSWDFNPHVKPLPFDPEQAAEWLDEAGWVDRNGDGIRDKDGVKFSFELLGANSPAFQQLAPILTEAFRKVGIEMTERVIEFALMSQMLKERRFDASVQGVSFDIVQDPYQSWHSSGTNYFNFKNDDSDKLLEQARLEFDEARRKATYWQWQELIHEEQPVTFLYYQLEPAAYSKRFQNVQWLPLRPGYDLTSWWTPKRLQKYGKQ